MIKIQHLSVEKIDNPSPQYLMKYKLKTTVEKTYHRNFRLLRVFLVRLNVQTY